MKAEQFQYNSEEEFMSDMQLMFDNAKYFNEEGSLIHEDAIKLEKVVKDKKAVFTPLGSHSGILATKFSIPLIN